MRSMLSDNQHFAFHFHKNVAIEKEKTMFQGINIHSNSVVVRINEIIMQCITILGTESAPSKW